MRKAVGPARIARIPLPARILSSASEALIVPRNGRVGALGRAPDQPIDKPVVAEIAESALVSVPAGISKR
jgi:hypothetical protein